MYVAFHEPHEPVASPKKMVDSYMSVSENHNQAQYFANVANLDAAVGKLLAALKTMKLDENTLVVFTSDNGPETWNRYGPASQRSYGVPGPLRGMKLWTTDAGFRVAGIMRWPGKIKAGQTVKHTISALDFFPTFCNLAGTTPPADLKLDGANFLPALENKPIDRKKPLVWAYYSALNKRRVAMRDGEWKVLAKLNLNRFKLISKRNEAKVKDATLSDFQIFKVSEDIGESKDLSTEQPEKLAELKKKLETHYKELLEDSHVW
jgi:arylsulfatase A